MSYGKLLETHTFVFNPNDAGGESLTLSTNFHHSDGEVYSVQELTLMCYGNSATFNLSEMFTPERLRQLADQLEQAEYNAWKEVENLNGTNA